MASTSPDFVDHYLEAEDDWVPPKSPYENPSHSQSSISIDNGEKFSVVGVLFPFPSPKGSQYSLPAS